MTLSISGYHAPGFEKLADAFAAGFAERPHMGAALNVVVEG